MPRAGAKERKSKPSTRVSKRISRRIAKKKKNNKKNVKQVETKKTRMEKKVGKKKKRNSKENSRKKLNKVRSAVKAPKKSPQKISEPSIPEKRQYSLRKKTMALKENNEETMQKFREGLGIDENEEEDNMFWKNRTRKNRRRLIQHDEDWRSSKKQSGKRKGLKLNEASHSDLDEGEKLDLLMGKPEQYSKMQMLKLPNQMKYLSRLKRMIKQKISTFSKLFFFENDPKIRKNPSKIGEHAIPICADIRTFNFKNLDRHVQKCTGRQFDVIMMDPPWKLATSAPSRGVAIAYDSLSDDEILDIPLYQIQSQGFLFLWVINARYAKACDMMITWGYEVIDEIAWVKKTVTGKMAKGHGYYLQHAKETCLIGFKGDLEEFMTEKNNFSKLPVMNCVEKEKKNFDLKTFRANTVLGDVIFSERRGQSQKPNEIYEFIEDLVPNGNYLEIFGRRNNLRNKWVTIGNEL